MRTVGVEEEFLLVDPRTGEPVALADRLLDRDERITAEFLAQMIELRTSPHDSTQNLLAELCALRAAVAARAARESAAPAALGTSPLPVTGVVMPVERYGRILDEYGVLAREQITCGCHVHVQVDDAEEGASVLDGLRVWLPTLLSLTAGSPFRSGQDTGFASYRWQMMTRWPVSGPPPVVGSADGYRRCVDRLLATGILLDEGMVYLDARLSSHLPTVEVRVADVCPDVRTTVLLASLVRALVETVARRGPGPGTPGADDPGTAQLRLATWRASRWGLAGSLVSPVTGRPVPASKVVQSLVDEVRPALQDAGELRFVEEGVGTLLARGGEACRQRQVYRRTGALVDVVSDVVRRTADLPGPDLLA